MKQNGFLSCFIYEEIFERTDFMKRIISLVLSFAILLTAFCITAYAGTTETNYKYLDRFLEKYSYLENGYLYDELYEYYADDNTGDTPDWVLIFASGDCPEPGTASGIFDEYYIFEHAYYYPYGLGYFIYIPEKNDFFTLEFAWMENVEGIEKAQMAQLELALLELALLELALLELALLELALLAQMAQLELALLELALLELALLELALLERQTSDHMRMLRLQHPDLRHRHEQRSFRRYRQQLRDL